MSAIRPEADRAPGARVGAGIAASAVVAFIAGLIGASTVALNACATTCPDPGGSERLAPAVGQQVDVHVLWTAGEGDHVKQGLSPTTIKVSPQHTPGPVRVSMVEGASLQSGEAWRASVWMAAIQASVATGRKLSEWSVSVEVDTGRRDIDGPSAGGVLSAAIAVGLMGGAALDDMAMTGTINPDGSLGPVSGIPQKFKAALAAGKKRLGYPVGQRYDRDLVSGEMVDLRATFGGPGREVRELRDIYDAFEFVSGKPLAGRLRPLSQSEMEPPERVYKAIERAAQIWMASAQHNYKIFKALKLKSASLDAEWQALEKQFAAADRLMREGMAPAGYWRAAELFIRADAALHLAELLKRIRARDLVGAEKFVGRIERTVNRRVATVTKKYRSAAPRSVSDVMSLTDGMEALSVAYRSLEHVRNEQPDSARRLSKALKGLPSKGALTPTQEAELLAALFAPVELLILANVNAVVADHSLTFRLPGKPAGPDRLSLDRVARLLDTSARANLKYFEATSVRRLSNERNISEASARDQFPDDVYQNARLAPLVVAARLKPAFTDRPIATTIAELAGSLDRYVSASVVIAKHYSLALELDERGAITGIGRGKALITMLALAERMAREHAARAKLATGTVPVPAQLTYQIARAYREGSKPEDKLTALEQFWRSSLFSQLAVLLPRPKVP